MENRHHLPTTTSTMDVAAQLIREGAPNLTVITADTQTSGRGRQGRSWTTFPGHSLAATWVVRHVPAQHLAFIFALAVIHALNITTPGLNLTIKWPNDVLLNNKKLAGILVETHKSGQGPAAAVGLGLNLTRSPAMGPDFPGTTLQDALTSPVIPSSRNPVPAAESLLGSIHTCVMHQLALYEAQGWQALAPDYTAHCQTLWPQNAVQVRVQGADGNTVLPAKINALQPDGSLDVVTPDGKHQTVTNADKLFHDYLRS